MALPSWKKYKKDYLLTFAAIIVGLLAVSSDGFSDMAQTKFWWSFWTIIQVLALVACIGGWFYLKKKDNEFNKGQ